jgi:hypothetical protein
MRRFVLPAVIVAALLDANPVFACDCAAPPLADTFRAADVVFAGVVTAVRLPRPTEPDGEALTVVEIGVRKAWKGVRAQTVTLHTHRNLFSCDGHEFVVGQRYLVFAARNAPEISARYGLPRDAVTYGVTLCGGTLLEQLPLAREHERALDRLVSQ